MKTNKYWISTVHKLVIGQETVEVPILAGSNVSKADAETVANEIVVRVQNKIDKKESLKDYEPLIKEWICDEIDEKNIITVNRYGAKVLNTTEYTILDLDDIPWEFWDIFGGTKGFDKKTLILQRFKKRIAKNSSLGDDMRIYETTKGLRIICKKYISPKVDGFRGLMAKFKVDRIYAYLCMTQDCYRARLTPKPFRIKQTPMRIKSPLDCETEAYVSWSAEYERKSKSYSVVKLIETIGSDFSSDRAIHYHDRICSCGSFNPLA